MIFMQLLAIWLGSVLELPQPVITALAHCIKYLADFGLTNIFRQCQLFKTFGSRSTMLLNANTVDNLYVSYIPPLMILHDVV